MQTTSPSPTITTAATTFTTWLEHTRDLSPHTVRAYTCDVTSLARHIGPTHPVTEIDAAALRAYFDLQRAHQLSSASLRRRAAGLRAFFAYLHHTNQIPENPWPPEGFTFRPPRRLPRAIPRTELTRLLRHLRTAAHLQHHPDPHESLTHLDATTTLLGTALMVTTGVRVSELTSIHTTDIDIAGGRIQVIGKGRRERVVYLPDPWLLDVLQAYQHTRDRLGVTHSRLLINASGDPLTPTRMRARLSHAARDAGLRQHVTPHMLRHTAATQLIESGTNIRFVQRLLGHASLTTTEIYTHVTDQALQHAITTASVLQRTMTADN